MIKTELPSPVPGGSNVFVGSFFLVEKKIGSEIKQLQKGTKKGGYP